MECVNCGKRGHSFRDCKEPTASFGVVAVRKVHDTDLDSIIPKYLLIRRRDSLGYVDFLRGKYTLANQSYIEILIKQMTKEERERLLTTTFDTLWVKLWNAQNTRQFRSEHESAKKIFETIKSTGDVYGKLLSKYIADANAETTWEEPEWGFPKGRRSPYENEMTCALREFTEETGLSAKDIVLRKDEAPEYEEYTGTNGIRYKHTYYIGDCDTEVSINPTNRVQTREVGGIGWFSFEEAYMKIRDTNPEKRAVLARIHARIHKIKAE